MGQTMARGARSRQRLTVFVKDYELFVVFLLSLCYYIDTQQIWNLNTKTEISFFCLLVNVYPKKRKPKHRIRK
jgi:hypothetical protein